MARSRKKRTKYKPATGRRPRSFEESVSPADALDTLFAERYHGAINIRGIRYQIRYAVLRAVELAIAVRRGLANTAQDNVASVQFEGIEDVDLSGNPALLPIEISDADSALELVQLKTADAAWSWHKLGEPLVGFLEALRTRAVGLQFRLVANFPFDGDLNRLAHFSKQPAGTQRTIHEKFRKLCRKVGGTDEEADRLLRSLRLESVPEADLRARLGVALAELTGVTDGDALDAYELMLAGRALAWAEERTRVHGADVLEVTRRLEEGIARQDHYAAQARHWVGQVEYVRDEQPDDFFTGKRVRLGHVVDGLDVPRPMWLNRIGRALNTAGVCVIRAPSGHGKSTLAFRYIVEHWPARETTVVHSAQTPEQVAAIADYLRFRAQLGLPVRVLIDADYRTRLWPQVVDAAAAVGAQVLITVRTEDWHRYALDALTRREILEPTLDLEEAERIFHVFAERGRVHPSVSSAAWAYERLRAPQLLLEYVYLITHGQMLEERLRDQVREFRRLNEDPQKTELLRLASLANALGAPVDIGLLLGAVTLQDDPQAVVRSLIGEYLSLEDGLLTGLHWVRSEHVARILHEGGIPPVARTALTAAALVPRAGLPFLVANALRWEGMDRGAFIGGLVERYRNADNPTLLAVVDGLYQAGEREFFEANRAQFDEAYRVVGPGGITFLSYDVAPILRPGIIESMAEIMRERADAWLALGKIRDRIGNVQRGLGRVRTFLESVMPGRDAYGLIPADAAVGTLLDWCALAGVRLPYWAEARDPLIADHTIFERGVEAVAMFAQGLFRYDRDAYEEWFERHREDLLPFLQLHSDSLSLELTEPSSVLQELDSVRQAEPRANFEPTAGDDSQSTSDEAAKARADVERYGVPMADVAITYAVDHTYTLKPNEQSMQRLELLRRTLPFVGRYQAQGEYLLPLGLEPPLDDTVKSVPRWNLPFPSDVQKNVVWGGLVEAAYHPDTLYALQERWFELRSLALRVATALGTVLKRLLQGRQPRAEDAFGGDGALLQDFERIVKLLPQISERTFERLTPQVSDSLRVHLQRGAPNRWISAFQTFYQQFWQSLNARGGHTGKLAVINLRDAAEALEGMHAFFAELFRDSPDYFDTRELDERENVAYTDLVLLVEGLITQPLGYTTDRPLEVLRHREAERSERELARIVASLTPFMEPGRPYLLPTGVARSGGLRSVPIGVPVRDAFEPQADLLKTAEALISVAGLADTFWLIPVKHGTRVTDGGYYLSSRLLQADVLNDWDERLAQWGLLFPTEVPESVLALLPPLPVVPPSPPFHAQIAGLRTAAEMYIARRRAIARIRLERDHPYLRELEERQRASLAEWEDQIRETVATARVALRGARGAQPLTDVIRDSTAVYRFLEVVESLLGAEQIDSVILAPWPPERLIDATQIDISGGL